MEAVAACLKIFMGLALVHFQKYWLLSKIFFTMFTLRCTYPVLLMIKFRVESEVVILLIPKVISFHAVVVLVLVFQVFFILAFAMLALFKSQIFTLVFVPA